MNRKTFIKNICGFCILASYSSLIGNLESCVSPALMVKADAQNKIKLDLQSFQQNPIQIVRTPIWDYDLAVRQKEDGTFETLSLKCTHADQELQSTNNGYVCAMHGSVFAKNGTVLKGPASAPLKKINTLVENNHVVIQL